MEWLSPEIGRLLLQDEPLSNLDLGLREELRANQPIMVHMPKNRIQVLAVDDG